MIKQKPVPFNSPLEIGLRALFLLDAFSGTFISTQQLVYFDYLMVHSGDVDGGPNSLHAPVPNRTGEWLVRREVLETGLGILIQHELATLICGKDGIYFQASDLTHPFIRHFTGEYAENLKSRALWVKTRFGTFSELELSKFMTAHIASWGIDEGVSIRGKIFAN